MIQLEFSYDIYYLVRQTNIVVKRDGVLSICTTNVKWYGRWDEQRDEQNYCHGI